VQARRVIKKAILVRKTTMGKERTSRGTKRRGRFVRIIQGRKGARRGKKDHPGKDEPDQAVEIGSYLSRRDRTAGSNRRKEKRNGGTRYACAGEQWLKKSLGVRERGEKRDHKPRRMSEKEEIWNHYKRLATNGPCETSALQRRWGGGSKGGQGTDA